MTKEDWDKAALPSEEKDAGANLRRGSPANTVRRTIKRMKTQERPGSTE